MTTKARKRTTVPIRQLQRNASELMERVRNGEQIDITNHGRLVGHIIPPDPEEEAWQRLVEQGLVDPDKGEPGGLAGWRTPAREQDENTGSLSEALLELRDEENR